MVVPCMLAPSPASSLNHSSTRGGIPYLDSISPDNALEDVGRQRRDTAARDGKALELGGIADRRHAGSVWRIAIV